MTAQSKSEVFSELRARLYAGTLELYDNPDTVTELRGLRTRYTVGSASVVKPRVGGSHGDIAQALAVAVREARSRAPASPWAAHVGYAPAYPAAFSDGTQALVRQGIRFSSELSGSGTCPQSRLRTN